ncbi:MAG: sn-glycerol-3-phosphate ABC transporter ATP-binding protein UgpC [Rhodobacteraceae bacterium]|jgi:multiple sugar transport system ATP-binding protein|nr:sn-glycerol-3-phosphate ABC transporter ATP-binding protein UgpC [Paracoccaceae bacterium]
MAEVTIHDVRKSYGGTEIIRGVSVDVPDGAFVVLVGPSGCGKSTLLRMIAGLEDIGAGTIRIGGRVINDVEPKHRDIAMVFQNYALYPHMTVAENMGFSLRLGGRPRAEITEKVAEAARILGLSDYLARYPRELSGGQRQRVAMGRAMVRAPQVFLFDEPLSNLDAKLRVQMRLELKQLHARLRTTTIYVTHDQIEAMTMADRIVVMRDGRVEQVGPPLELYDRPANLFVAGFLGSPAMNTFAGTVTADRFAGDGIALDLPDATRAAAMGRAVIAGVRPESLVPDQDAGPIAMQVDVVEPTGSDTSVTGRIGPAPVTVLLRDRVAVDPGTVLRLSVRPGAVHLFDAGSGARLAG